MHEFKIDGPALRQGVPIHIAISALDNFQSVVDKSFLVFTGSKRMSARDREVFSLLASNFEKGSFLTKFEIVLTGVQLVLPLVSSLGPHNLWEFTKESFNFLKVLPELLWVNDLVRSLLTEDADERHRILRADSWSQSPLVC